MDRQEAWSEFKKKKDINVGKGLLGGRGSNRRWEENQMSYGVRVLEFIISTYWSSKKRFNKLKIQHLNISYLLYCQQYNIGQHSMFNSLEGI